MRKFSPQDLDAMSHVEDDYLDAIDLMDVGPTDRGCTWPAFDSITFEAESELVTMLWDEARGNLDICRWDAAEGCFEGSEVDEDEKLSQLETAMTKSALEEDDNADVSSVQYLTVGTVFDPREARRLLYGQEKRHTSLTQGGDFSRTEADIDPGEARDAVEALDAEQHQLPGRGAPTAHLAIEAAQELQLEQIMGLLETAPAVFGIGAEYVEQHVARQVIDRITVEREQDPVHALYCDPKAVKARLAALRGPSLQLSKVRSSNNPSVAAVEAAIAQREADERKLVKHTGMPSLRAEWATAAGVPSKQLIVLEHAAGPRLTETRRKPKYVKAAGKTSPQGFEQHDQSPENVAKLRTAWKAKRAELNTLMGADPVVAGWWEDALRILREKGIRADGRKLDRARLYAVKGAITQRKLAMELEALVIWLTSRGIIVQLPEPQLIDSIHVEAEELPGYALASDELIAA